MNKIVLLLRTAQATGRTVDILGAMNATCAKGCANCQVFRASEDQAEECHATRHYCHAKDTTQFGEAEANKMLAGRMLAQATMGWKDLRIA